MTLIGSDRRYAQLNDAALKLYKFRREDIVGQPAGHTVLYEDQATADAHWEQLLATNELYGERVIADGSGKLLRISFAVHGMTASGRWQALAVTLSAHLQAGDAELVAALETDGSKAFGPSLTPREREVVRRVALGASTRQIAADLYLSPATVRSHVRNAMVKTSAHTRAQLVAIVMGNGLIHS
jgi:DNA-binding CsgD family transcriptional regulator